jgi:hypothetical protein
MVYEPRKKNTYESLDQVKPYSKFGLRLETNFHGSLD